MGIFDRKITAGKIIDRLEELDEEVRSLRSSHKHLELEWEELYDKVRRQMARMSKRSAVDAPPLINDEPVVEEDDGIDPISRTILAQRNAPRART